MKKLIAMTALSLCFSSAFADSQNVDVHQLFSKNSFQIEAQSSDLNTDKKLSDIDWDFKLSLKTEYNGFVYSFLNFSKFSNDYAYGATVGLQDPFDSVTPYSEITYNHLNSNNKMLSSQQFDYDTGIKINHFSRLSPFLEADDFLDSSRWYIKTGAQFNVDNRFYLIGDYAFPSKTTGSQLGLGIGVAF
ncbi:MAG: hypothetical protein GWN00_21940 [Aliifodinibius sp.]|nr:hypothetical protein [Fodinibius sp.]NIV13618.1 hypothetical protein [Fodinibius sp.]NIY27365.1 hypothetical protein [Fodinibius sp.]